MHLLRKAIRSYKKRKKKGLIAIKNEDLLLSHFRKWKRNSNVGKNKNHKENMKKEQNNQDNQAKENKKKNKQAELLKNEKLKNIINKKTTKNKEKLKKFLKKCHKIASLMTKNENDKNKNKIVNSQKSSFIIYLKGI